MSKLLLQNLLGRIRRLASDSGDDAPRDGTLLDRFARHRDEDAFAELVRRHGAMVLGVGRTMLGDGHAAEDVFQAAFLVLARKAGSMTGAAAVGGWLYQVTCRVALQARSNAARRHRHESLFMSTRPEKIEPDAVPDDVRPILYEELDRLPAKYREPVVLCYLEGLTNEDAAQQLGWPVGTVKIRMARARDLLRGRLERRGIVLSATGVAALLAPAAVNASVPAGLSAITVRAAALFAGSAAVAPDLLSPAAVELAQGVTRALAVRKAVVTTVAVLAVGLAVAAGLLVHHPRSGGDVAPALAEGPAFAALAVVPDPIDGPFPRRLLAITPCNYLFMNPVAYGRKDDDTHARIGTLARSLRIPESQVFELSDSAPGDLARPPFKDIVEQAIKDFAADSRAQDRIVLYFSGHARDVGGELYLVPMEGDGDDRESLVSLRGVLAQLAACKARQKILMLDVCRHDPAYGRVRPDGGPMTAAFEAVLAKPPEGVQVWTACSAREHSFDDGGGSYFLGTLATALKGTTEPKLELPEARPDESIPLTELNEKVAAWTTDSVRRAHREKQTPRVYGTEKPGGAAFDPRAKAATRVRVEFEESGWQPNARPLVGTILKEASDIPDLKRLPAGVRPLRREVFPVFSAAILKEYYTEVDETPYRTSVGKAATLLANVSKAFPQDPDGAPAIWAANIQKTLALTNLELEEAIASREEVARDRAREKSKRWLARGDYTAAIAMKRLAYLQEYTSGLGDLRKEGAPQTGWHVVTGEKINATGDSGKTAREYLKKGDDLLDQIARDHAGSPYEVLAKRQRRTYVGLKWQPTAP